MWKCAGCAEQIEDAFASCWNCGTGSDGAPDPSFEPEIDSGAGEVEVMAAASPALQPFTRQELGALVCRCVALWILAHAAISSLSVLMLILEVLTQKWGYPYSDFPAGSAGLPGTLLCGGQLFIGWVLWNSADNVGRWLVRHPDSPIHVLQVDGAALLSVATAVIGMWLLVSQVRSTFAWLYVFMTISSSDRFETLLVRDFQAQVCSAIVVLVVGFWLLLGSRGIAQAILRLRSAPSSDHSSSALSDIKSQEERLRR